MLMLSIENAKVAKKTGQAINVITYSGSHYKVHSFTGNKVVTTCGRTINDSMVVAYKLIGDACDPFA